MNRNVKKSECLANTGRWIDPFLTKQSCESVQACVEPIDNDQCLYKYDYTLATIDNATNKTRQECLDCGGTYVFIFNLFFPFLIYFFHF